MVVGIAIGYRAHVSSYGWFSGVLSLVIALEYLLVNIQHLGDEAEDTGS